MERLAHQGPSTRAARNMNMVCKTMGTGDMGRGMAIKAPTAMRAAKRQERTGYARFFALLSMGRNPTPA